MHSFKIYCYVTDAHKTDSCITQRYTLLFHSYIHTNKSQTHYKCTSNNFKEIEAFYHNLPGIIANVKLMT